MNRERTEEPGILETDAIPVRTMREEDLEAVVAIDAQATGRRRPKYFQQMLKRALKEAAVQVSLVAECDGQTAGFLVATLDYGEYGVLEPSASIDAISVDPRYRGRRVGRALMRQLRLNLSALHVTIFRTEVAWDDFDLLAFFKREGFSPGKRICLESALDPTAPRD